MQASLGLVATSYSNTNCHLWVLPCYAGKPGAGSDLKIHVDKDKRVMIPGITKRAVSSKADVAAVLTYADGNRTVGGHDANAHSSRSHMVVTVEVIGTNQ